MARAYEEIAVDALASHLESELPGKLPAGNDEPQAYVKAFVPSDGRFPLIQVYDESCEPYEDSGQRHSFAVVDCTVAVTWTGGTDQAANELVMRRYVQAIREAIMEDTTLGAQVVQAEWTDADRDFPIEDNSASRHTRALGVAVLVQDDT